jgi:hypothetical protein
MATPKGTERTPSGLIVPQGMNTSTSTVGSQSSKPSMGTTPAIPTKSAANVHDNNQIQSKLINQQIMYNLSNLDPASASELLTLLGR